MNQLGILLMMNMIMIT